MVSASLLVTGQTGLAAPWQRANLDMPGFDYRHFDLPRSSVRLCEDSCLRDQACVAWTFVKPALYGAHAACWLKNRLPPRTHADPCCVSGGR